MDPGQSDTQHFDDLVVRLVAPHEMPGFNAAPDEHHVLGHNLAGQMLRYVACGGDQWVALVGFGSAAPSLAHAPRELGRLERAGNACHGLRASISVRVECARKTPSASIWVCSAWRRSR